MVSELLDFSGFLRIRCIDFFVELVQLSFVCCIMITANLHLCWIFFRIIRSTCCNIGQGQSFIWKCPLLRLFEFTWAVILMHIDHIREEFHGY